MQVLLRPLKFTGHLVLAVTLLTGGADLGAAPSLGRLAYTAGRLSCTLYGESNATYIVLASTNLSAWTPLVTSQAPGATRTLDVAVPHEHAFFKVQSVPMSGLAFALAARGSITITGSLDTDSFNSEDPTLSTDGRYDPAKIRDRGDVAAQGQVVVAPTNSTDYVKIRGRVFTGPGGTVHFTDNAAAGSTNWISAGYTGIEPGWFADNMNAAFGYVGVPFTGGYFTPASGDYLGTNYAYLLDSRRFMASSITLAAIKTMMVIGNAELYVPGNFAITGQSRIIIVPGASLKLYVGGTANFTGQGIYNQTHKPMNCFVYGLPSCSSVTFSNNLPFIGVVYAPNATLRMRSDTNAVDFIGANITAAVDISGRYRFHYDESLLAWVGPPGIHLQPSDQTVFAGSDVNFSVLATGKAPLSYQWRKEGAGYLNQTNSTLTLTAVQPYLNQRFFVEVANELGQVTSRMATLLVITQPNSKTLFVGETIDMSVFGVGSRCQWRKDESDLAGQTNYYLVIRNAQLRDSGAYRVAVNTGSSWITSQVATVTVRLMAPAILQQPVGQTVFLGAPTSLNVIVTGTPPLSVQWRKDGTALEGQTNQILSFASALATDAGGYDVVVSNAAGSITSQVASLTVQLMAVLQQPTDQTVLAGAPVSFSLVATGTPPLSIQWRKDGIMLGGETNFSLFFTSVQTVDAGGYDVVVSNAWGAMTSAVARLAVQCSLTVNVSGSGNVTWLPSQPNFAPGSLVTLTANAAANHEFVNWSGDAGGNQNPLTVTMDGNKSITAHFLPTYTIAVATNGYGTVTLSPLKARYRQGDVVEMTATPARWHLLSRWNDGITINPRSITVASNASFTAFFTPSTPLETLNLGGVTRTAPVGMPAPLVNDVFVVAEPIHMRGSAEITLLTTFTNGTILFTLDGSDPTVSPNLYTGPFIVQNTVTLRAVAYTADFIRSSVQSDPLTIVILPTLTATTDGGGSVTIDPPAGDYFSNSLAVVTATPLPGWTFLYWLGDATGTNPIVNLTMTEHRQVKAVFGTTLRTNTVGAGNIALNPLLNFYPYGTEVLVTASPQSGNYFAFWGSSASGTNNPLTFAVTNPNPLITAVFLSSGGGTPVP